MGKKVKTGKARKDKFYQLAKESGYRARSAFKLIQLNRKFNFLEKSRVCIDLCAAPGGWLQVCQQQMPMSSHIIGVDLVPIKPINGSIITLTEDITTDKCRAALKKELQTWKADVVLHDGAPNVGQNWIHDAFQQAQLTLEALKLATVFLKKGGWFVTKVFRSKDYHAVLWVFNQLFKKVHATKPQASRNESAEIFVVCQGYYAPDTLDPKFTDPKYIFKDVDDKSTTALNLIHPEKKKKNQQGYAEGDYTLHHKLSVTEFVSSQNHLELLADANEIVLDDERLADHKETTTEMKECLKDIKVLGKREIRNIIKWRTKMNKYLESLKPEDEEDKEDENKEEKMDEDSDAVDSDTALDNQLADMKAEELKNKKRKKKKVSKERSKLRQRISMDMVIPGDKIDTDTDMEVFSLRKMTKQSHLKELEEGEYGMDDTEEKEEGEEEEEEEAELEFESDEEDSDGDEDDDDDDEEESEDNEEDSEDEEEANPLVVELEEKTDRAERKTNMWFNKGSFAGLEEDDDEDLEIEKMTEDYQKRGGVILEKKNKKTSEKKKSQKTQQKQKKVDDDDDEDDDEEDDDDDDEVDLDSDSGNVSNEESSDDEDKDDDDDDSDSDAKSDADSDFDLQEIVARVAAETNNKASKSGGGGRKDGFEVVPPEEPGRFSLLDPAALALGEELVSSQKRRREIIEESFNRHTFNDDGLPDWFLEDERKHRKYQLPVSRELVKDYKDRARSINERPIKKIAEAKARKKRKGMKKLEKVRKKAEAITDSVDQSEKEKWQQIKQIYKKAGLLKNKKEEVTYVVCKKGSGKRVRRPAGVQGRFKVVDHRMKKDMNAAKRVDQKKGKKGGKAKKQHHHSRR